MRDHTKLRAFQLADELAIAVYNLTATMPRQEQFWSHGAEIRRAAVSCAPNIVEDCAHTSESDYLHFLEAYGSAREVAHLPSLARRLGMLTHETPFARVEVTHLETGKVLNALIRSLRERG